MIYVYSTMANHDCIIHIVSVSIGTCKVHISRTYQACHVNRLLMVWDTCT